MEAHRSSRGCCTPRCPPRKGKGSAPPTRSVSRSFPSGSCETIPLSQNSSLPLRPLLRLRTRPHLCQGAAWPVGYGGGQRRCSGVALFHDRSGQVVEWDGTGWSGIGWGGIGWEGGLLTHTPTPTHTHARTHARTRPRTHARMHAIQSTPFTPVSNPTPLTPTPTPTPTAHNTPQHPKPSPAQPSPTQLTSAQLSPAYPSPTQPSPAQPIPSFCSKTQPTPPFSSLLQLLVER